MKMDMQEFIIDRTKSPEFSGKIDFVLFPVQKGKVFKNIDMRKYEVLKEILYLIFDYPHKYNTFKHFDV